MLIHPGGTCFHAVGSSGRDNSSIVIEPSPKPPVPYSSSMPSTVLFPVVVLIGPTDLRVKPAICSPGVSHGAFTSGWPVCGAASTPPPDELEPTPPNRLGPTCLKSAGSKGI